MSEQQYDLVIIGAGSGGLTAAGFAARLGAKVALVEKNRIGGDCTWTGCVPSKALLKVAKVAHEARTAPRFGITVGQPVVDMAAVRAYVQSAIGAVYELETPEQLRAKGITVIQGAARFLDPQTIAVGADRISAKYSLVTTGARPIIPDIKGLASVPFVTYEQIFSNEVLPKRMLVIGGGPIGLEMTQAYQRLGAQVTVVANEILPKDDPDAREVIRRVLESEGVQFVSARASAVRMSGQEIVLTAGASEFVGDLLLVAAGRRPNVDSLDLEKAGVSFSNQGISVDSQLRTNVKHIYAAGDVTGGYQFTHFAGWQGFQAVRNALLPGNSSGLSDLVPWVTFTDPEIAHIGLTEAHAKQQFGDAVQVRRWDLHHTDRAVSDGEREGFTKLIAKSDGTILGATIVAPRAGEAITEIIVAMKHGLKLADLAGVIHPYPTYSTAVQQLAADATIESLLSGVGGAVLKGLSKWMR